MEIDLLEKYPKSKRNLDERASTITDEDRRIAKQFGKDYFDGSRNRGYGGYSYDGRWLKVLPDFIKHYNLTNDSKVLDLGSGKGFLLHDLKQLLPGITVVGIDISQYGVDNTMEDVKPYVSVGNAKDLSQFKDKEFDLVIAINTIHNLDRQDCIKALKEMQRISKHAFLTVDAWRNDEEKEKMLKWNITALTYLHVNDWVKLFEEAGYTGDYFWFIP